ncbi:MAG: rod shape-determining protein MreC [Peptococcaceae bacterium]|nr:rod shape-determining protein MreC [Peptococcaceae bacterium]
MSKKKIVGTIAAMLTVSIIFITTAANTIEPREDLTILEKGLRIAASPFQHGMAAIDDWRGRVMYFFVDRTQLQEENIFLKKEISLLKQEVDTLKDAALENERLREMLAYQEETKGQYNLQVAKIIAENDSNLQHTVILNLGSDDGVASGMSVINQNGLIGRVINVQPSTSEVLLLSDRESAVGARVWATRETIGVAEGGGDNDAFLELIHLAHDAEIQEGDEIITSGLDSIFPAGIRIGKIVNVEFDSSGLTKTAYIQPYVDFTKLEEVFIMLNSGEGGI